MTAKTSKDLINPVNLFQNLEDIIICGASTVKNLSANIHVSANFNSLSEMMLWSNPAFLAN